MATGTGIRGVVALILLAVLVAGMGVVAAQSLANDAPRGLWDTGDSSGEIVLDGSSYYSVYQGESDIDGWWNVNGGDVGGSVLDANSGGGELELTSSIPGNQETGRYSGNGVTARVRAPSVTRMEAYNPNGARLSSGASVRRSDRILIRADWNFVEAEDLRIEVRESGGTRVTSEVLARDASNAQQSLLPSGFSQSFLDRQVQGTGSTGYSTAYWLLDLRQLSTGTHEIRVEGVQDLNFEDARKSFRLAVGSETRPSLSFDRTVVSQGERLRYTVASSDVGRYHAVAIPRDSLRTGADADRVFRLIGDTERRGSTSNFVYGVVRVTDRGTGVGGVETSQLRTGSASVRLYRSASSASAAADRVGVSGDEVERRSVEVGQSKLTVNLPSTYSTGQTVDLSGTASPGVSRVVLYVRDRDDWEILPLNGRDTHSVRADGTWGVRNVVLSDEDYGGRNFRFPGSYSVAVVDAADLQSPPQRSLTTTELNRMASSRQTVSTLEPTFVGNVHSYGGQIAYGDRVRFSGTTTGADSVVVGFVGDRDVRAEVVRGTRGGFVDRQIDLDGMRRGPVDAFAISPGRDGEFGQGTANDADGSSVSISTPSEFASYVRSFDGDGRTRAQRISRIRAASVDRAGSDDLVQTSSFRINPARTSIRDVLPGSHPELSGLIPIEQGETVFVRGSTNRNPADTSIDVEVTEGPDADRFGHRTVTTWSRDGIWRASFNSDGVEPGSYTVTADDGSSSHSVSFTVMDVREREPDEIEPGTPETPRQPDESSDGDPDDGDGEDGGEDEPTPGFTVFTAVAALLALALATVYSRRRREY